MNVDYLNKSIDQNASSVLDESIRPLVNQDHDQSRNIQTGEDDDIEIKREGDGPDDSPLPQIQEPIPGSHGNKKEVDFHHKIAYRFEKAYRLAKKQNEKKMSLNNEIIQCIRDHQSFIDKDPIALFYCLFFCIYYKNEEIVEFLRDLIQKIHAHEKIDKLLEYIDVNGLDRLRTRGDQINQLVYHMVFYQAVDDDLKIVYSQIIKQLKFI